MTEEEKFYMVHKHDAKRAGLHYDLRLEEDGVLKSWAIPKGMPKSGRHLAIQTPDHSMEYGRWEGTIKSGYGAGKVEIDTSGEYITIDKSSNNWKFKILSGKYRGIWRLTHWKGDKWLISKSGAKKMAEDFEAKNYGHKRFRKDTPAPVRTVKYKKTQCKALTNDGYPCPNPIQWDRRDRGDYCGHHHRNRQETVKTVTKEEAEKRKKETADLMAWAMQQDFAVEEVSCNDCLWGGAHSELGAYRDKYGNYMGCPQCKSDHLIDFTGQNKYAESFSVEEEGHQIVKLVRHNAREAKVPNPFSPSGDMWLVYGYNVYSIKTISKKAPHQQLEFRQKVIHGYGVGMTEREASDAFDRQTHDALFAQKDMNAESFNAEDRPEEERMTRPQAEALAGKMIALLEPSCSFIEIAGSYRRGREDPGDLDIVVILKPRETLPKIVESLAGEYSSVSWVGEKKSQIIVDGIKVDIRVSTPRALGAALLYFTGPAGYNIGIRRSAKSRGMKLNEYGIFDRESNEYLGGATEEEIYAILGKNYRPPEERRAEGKQEFNSAVIFPKSWNSAGPVERTIILHTALQEARLQEALLELETNIRLGIISEDQAMKMFMKLLK